MQKRYQTNKFLHMGSGDVPQEELTRQKTYKSHSLPSSPHTVMKPFRTPVCWFFAVTVLALTDSNVKGRAAQKRLHVHTPVAIQGCWQPRSR